MKKAILIATIASFVAGFAAPSFAQTRSTTVYNKAYARSTAANTAFARSLRAPMIVYQPQMVEPANWYAGLY